MSKQLLTIDQMLMKKFGYGDFKTDREIFKSSIYDSYRENERERNKLLTQENIEGSCGKCPYCGSENTYLIEKQKRSADEPKNFTIHCGNCREAWESK